MAYVGPSWDSGVGAGSAGEKRKAGGGALLGKGVALRRAWNEVERIRGRSVSTVAEELPYGMRVSPPGCGRETPARDVV